MLAADVTEAEKNARPDITAMICPNPLCPCGRVYITRKPYDYTGRVAQVVSFLRQLEQRLKFDRAQAEDLLERGEEPPPINPIHPPAPPPTSPPPPRRGEWRHLFGEE